MQQQPTYLEFFVFFVDLNAKTNCSHNDKIMSYQEYVELKFESIHPWLMNLEKAYQLGQPSLHKKAHPREKSWMETIQLLPCKPPGNKQDQTSFVLSFVYKDKTREKVDKDAFWFVLVFLLYKKK